MTLDKFDDPPGGRHRTIELRSLERQHSPAN
jgi:hypothetical protein